MASRSTIGSGSDPAEIEPDVAESPNADLDESATPISANGAVAASVATAEAMRARLYPEIGHLKVELDWLTRKTGLAS
jgi:hypothetical protein